MTTVKDTGKFMSKNMALKPEGFSVALPYGKVMVYKGVILTEHEQGLTDKRVHSRIFNPQSVESDVEHTMEWCCVTHGAQEHEWEAALKHCGITKFSNFAFEDGKMRFTDCIGLVDEISKKMQDEHWEGSLSQLPAENNAGRLIKRFASAINEYYS